uniref:Uncharacterized protein LOC100367085 n=1 Tax=Saccoglossus kowalevskii TaxID=10224 RepID=A0ABM0MPB5_SACKO|nr:PREDICTED: uncharacterized protein LOC100367085 [Saccoglossus kowalevskii]
MQPGPSIEISDAFLKDKSGAIAIYRAPPMAFRPGTVVTNVSLIHALVYSSDSDIDQSLLNTLAPGQTPIMISEYQSESISRCLSYSPLDMFAYRISMPTPGTNNNCSLPLVVINEIYIDLSGSGKEQFIELADGGKGCTALDTLIVVLFNGQDDRAYKTISLQNYRTDSNGYFILGTRNVEESVDVVIDELVLTNSIGAVTLYQTNPASYPNGIKPKPDNLVDAVVYSTTDSTDSYLLDVLLPGQSYIHVNDDSISRCICCPELQSSAFRLVCQSPRQPNNCTDIVSSLSPLPQLDITSTQEPNTPQVVINELNSNNPGTDNREFVELKGPINADISGLVVVFYDGTVDPAISYKTIDLTGHNLDSFGLFLIGSSNMSPRPDISLPDKGGLIHYSVAAVAIYKGASSDFPDETPVTDRNLLDAIVYTNDTTKTNRRLLDVLTPYQRIFVEDDNWHSSDEAISRCSCCNARKSSVYTLSLLTPGKDNDCPTDEYSHPIQMRLTNADCDVWLSNDKYIQLLMDNIVDGIESGCHCGFSSLYLQDSEIICGSVVYDANLIAMNEVQLTYLLANYTKYITETKYIKIFNKTHTVDNKCVFDCVLDWHEVTQDETGLSTGVIVAMVIGALVAVVLVILIIGFSISRQRKTGSGDMFASTFHISNACELGDMGEENVLGIHNPLYGLTKQSPITITDADT